MFTLYGFTTVVDTGSVLQNTSKLRGLIVWGEVTGPRIIATKASLFPPDGVPIYLRDLLSSWTPDQPETPDLVVKIVQGGGGEGQDILKLFTGSLVTYEKIKPMPVDTARAAVDEAHRQGRLAFAHPSNIEGVHIVLAANVDVLAHTTPAPGVRKPGSRDRCHQASLGSRSNVEALEICDSGGARSIARRADVAERHCPAPGGFRSRR